MQPQAGRAPKSGSRGRRGPARGPTGASPRGLGGWLSVGLLTMGEAPGVGGLVSTVTPLAASATVTSKQGGSHSCCPQSGAQAREQQQGHCGNTIPGSTLLVAFVSDVAHSEPESAAPARMPVRRITRRGIPGTTPHLSWQMRTQGCGPHVKLSSLQFAKPGRRGRYTCSTYTLSWVGFPRRLDDPLARRPGGAGFCWVD